MIRLQLPEVVAALAGQVVGELRRGSVSGVSTDSRSTRPGEIFFAIQGERHDGHAFVGQAFRAGALAAVVSRAGRAGAGTAGSDGDACLIVVDDTVAALGRLAAYHRRQLAARVIAVVGSNGKTTTKALIDHVLGERFAGRSSPKSFNNAIGVPLTLLSAVAADEYLVVEIGTNAPGEVAALAAIAQPDAAVVTSIGEEHLEGLVDLDGVAAEECSVLTALDRGGFAAVNIDDPRTWRHVAPFRPRVGAAFDREDAALPAAPGATLVTFGREASADLVVSECRYAAPWLAFTLNRRFPYRLRTPAPHMALNATAAIAVGRRFGLEHTELARRLESFEPPAWRSQVERVRGAVVINDAYNANPSSAAAALETLSNVAGRARRIVVFGEMRELGPRSAELHAAMAERIRRAGVDAVVLVGGAAALMRDALTGSADGPEVHAVPDAESAGAWLSRHLGEGDVALLKASRAVGLERALDCLRVESGAGAAA